MFSFNKDAHKPTTSSLSRLHRAQKRSKQQASNISDDSQKSKQPRKETTPQPQSDVDCPITSDIATEENNEVNVPTSFQLPEMCSSLESAGDIHQQHSSSEPDDSNQQPHSSNCNESNGLVQDSNELMQESIEQPQSECHRLALLNAELSSKSAALELECAKLRTSNIMLQSTLHSAMDKLSQVQFGANMILNNDEKTCLYTGLPTYQLFEVLFGLMQPFAAGVFVNEAKSKDQFFATLVKLRQNVLMTDLAY